MSILLLPGLADAVEARPDGPEEVLVAGRKDPDSPATAITPVTVVGADAIAASGATSLDQVLSRVPLFGTQGVSGNQNDGGYGAAFIDLHNLNFNRTLVLVNGRRFVMSGITTDEGVDMNAIPLAMIDHIDILSDGSQPRFGSDAIAGAVNIVLRKDFEGAEASLGGGATGKEDGAADTASVTLGHRFGRTSVILSAGQSHRNAILQSDRAWARDPISSAEPEADGRLTVTRGLVATAGGHAISGAGLDAVMTGPGQSRAFNAATDGYDPSTSRFLQPGLDRETVNLSTRTDLGNSVTAFTELSFAARRSVTEAAPATLGTAGTVKYPDGFVIPASNPFNPFQQDLTLQRVLTEVGPQRTTTDADILRSVVGTDGQAGGGDWSTSVNLGLTRQTYSTRNAVNLTRVFETLGNGWGQGSCAAADGCPPASYFGPGSLSPTTARWIAYTAETRSTYREAQVQASYAHPLLSLPAGVWTATGGVEYRREFGETMPDAVTVAGDQAGPDSQPTRGGYGSREAYLDLSMPLLKDRPFAHRLDGLGSVRYSDFDHHIGSFATWKTGLSWSPVPDLLLRATVGEGRRPPAITEAYGGATASFMTVQDPCDSTTGLLSNPTVAANCRKAGLTPQFTQASPLVDVANGGNPDLKAETSRNVSVGAVVTPRVLPGLSVSADYYDVRVANAINQLSDVDPNLIGNLCYGSPGLGSPYCALVQRIPSGPNAGQISRILSPDQNIGAIHTDGIDLAAGWRVGLDGIGTLDIDWKNSFLLDYLVQPMKGMAYQQYAGTLPSLGSTGSFSRYRSTLSADIARGDWDCDWTVRYIDGARVPGTDAALYARAPGIFYHDLEVRWRHQGLTVRVGIDNLFDQKPPALIDGATNTSVATYDVVGRYLYTAATVRF